MVNIFTLALEPLCSGSNNLTSAVVRAVDPLRSWILFAWNWYKLTAITWDFQLPSELRKCLYILSALQNYSSSSLVVLKCHYSLFKNGGKRYPEHNLRLRILKLKQPQLRGCCVDWLRSINKHEFCITVEIICYCDWRRDFNNTRLLQQQFCCINW